MRPDDLQPQIAPERRRTRRDAAVDPELEALRKGCERVEPDGRSLIAALWMVTRRHGPTWLHDAFFPRWARLLDADALTLDEAFGRPHPSGTRRGSVREMREARARVHAAVWRLMADPNKAIGRELFEEVGRLPGIFMSGATVDRRYNEALAAGALNVADFRKAHGAVALAGNPQ